MKLFGKRGILPFVLIVLSLILFVWNLYGIDEFGPGSGRVAGILSNLLVIVAMLFVILGNRKEKK